MKRMNISKILLLAAASVLASSPVAMAAKSGGRVVTENMHVSRHNGKVLVRANLVLDSLYMGGNKTLVLTPVITGPKGQAETLPAVMINGRNMHYAYERGSMKKSDLKKYNLLAELRRANGKAQSYTYTYETAMHDWMLAPDAHIAWIADTCGCGHLYGKSLTPPEAMNLNPAPMMRLVQITPAVTELPIIKHEGEARVQFEVDKTVLHAQPYRCKSGQLIDNRKELQVIEDSVRYALSDPNVEISHIQITGYASPESPYTHNDFLATNRSRALSDYLNEYLGDKYDLPRGVADYSAVPENWAEFRQQVLAAKDITEQQRKDLLELIDAPTYGPADFDAKEKTLKTDPRFAKLYAEKILPEWFPHLRATKFAISTRLRPMSDQKLAEVIEKTPQLLSLNQMMRVARLYPEGSPEFNHVIEIALKYYPDDQTANLNAAVAAIQQHEFDRAEELLKKAGDTPEAQNARGVLAANLGDFKAAEGYFRAAGNLPEAVKNLHLLEE